MKTITRSILLCSTALLLTLSPAPCRAVSLVEHNFDEMWRSTPQRLAVTNFNQTGTVEEDDITYTYTCSGKKAIFSLDFFNAEGKQKIAINLEDKGNYVTTSIINNLQQVEINCTSQKAKSNVKVYISTDGLIWDEPDNIEYGSLITATFPAGDYHVIILNDASANRVSIYQIDYYCLDLSACPNCFIYRPE